MNHGNSFIFGCAPFGLDDHVISVDGAIHKRSGFVPASVVLPSRSRGLILCGDQARAARIHSGLPWPPEAWVKKGEHLRRAPISLVWRALVEARDNQARWNIGGGVSFPLTQILVAHIVDLLPPLSKTDESLNLTIPIPNDLDEYGQENLLSELRRVLPGKEVRLLWRPVAAALTWIDAASDDMIVSVVKTNPKDFILVLYLGPDAIECVPFQLRIRRHKANNDIYIVPRRDRPTAITPLAGYDWIGGMTEQLPQVSREVGDGAFWQAFTSFPESWSILAGIELQDDELPRVWGGDGNYRLWQPDQQKIKELFNQTSCAPSKQIQAMLQSSCTLHGSHSSNLSWPQRLTDLVNETVNKQTEGRLTGMIVCGALAPASPPDWLTECFPVLEARGLNPSGPWGNRAPNRLWMSPGNEAIAQGSALFNLRLINGEPTYLDTLPQYCLLAMRDEQYTLSPLVDAQEVEGGEYYEKNITQRYRIEKDKPSLDVIVSRGSGHEELLESSTGTDALDRQIGKKVEGLSMAGASLIRHLVQTASSRDEAIKRVRENIRNIRERIPGKVSLYAKAYADLWFEDSDCSGKEQLSLWQSDSITSEAPTETPFRKLTFPFPALSPEDMPVDIHVKIRPAGGMASMEVVPQDVTFLHGRQVFVDYRTMRPCQLKELREDVRGWPPLEELAPHPEGYLWNPAKNLLKQFEQFPLRDNNFIELLNGMYDIIKSPKQYFFPVGGDMISLPLLSQNGLAGSQEGIDIITQFCEILQAQTSDINRRSPGHRAGQIGWLITRATWLYGTTPSNITNRINREITGTNVSTRTIEAGSRSLTDTRHLADLLDCLAKQVQNKGKLVIQSIRACRNILTLRHNGQDALNDNTVTILLKATLKEINGFAVANNYKTKFFVSIKLLLYLLRYRKCNPLFLKADSKETERIKDDLTEYLIRMKGCMTPARFLKAKDIISGTIDYLNYAGKTDFLNTLTEYSGADD